MKKIFILIILLGFYSNKAQVRIGAGSDPIETSEVLIIGNKLPGETEYRGVLIPRLDIPDLMDSYPVENPSPRLIVYNKNAAEKGFFSWAGNHWQRAYDKAGVLKLIVPSKNETSNSTSGVSQTTDTGGARGYTVGLANGEDLTGSWKAIPGLNKDFEITSATNTTTITANGELQISNTGTSTSQRHSYAIGIFINNKLFSVRPMVISGHAGMSCLTQSFDIKANLKNLPIPTDGLYNVKVAAITRSELSGGTSIVLNWGQSATGCSTINTFMARGTLSVQTQNFQ